MFLRYSVVSRSRFGQLGETQRTTMKPSPLQLRWVTYPSASYEIDEDFEGGDTTVQASVDVHVGFLTSGDHFVKLTISSSSATSSAYRFSITALAAFGFDLERAVADYKPRTRGALPPIIAVNMARIVYAGAREYMAMMTSRSTYGAAVLESLILEPSDVHISSDATVEETLKTVFGVQDDELIERRSAGGASTGTSVTTPAKPPRRPKAE